MRIGFVGAHVAVLPEESLARGPGPGFRRPRGVRLHAPGSRRGQALRRDRRLSPTARAARSSITPTASSSRTWTSSPTVLDVYKRDLIVENYYIGYLQASLYFRSTPAAAAPRAARSASGPRPSAATSTARAAAPERHRRDGAGQEDVPSGQGVLLRRRHLHGRPALAPPRSPRAWASWASLGRATRRANVPYEYLKIFKENGLRLLLVGYESGNQQILNNIKKGIRARHRQGIHQELPQARHHHPRHLHPRPARRDQGDHRGVDQVRLRDSTSRPSRCRWPPPIPAPSFTARP